MADAFKDNSFVDDLLITDEQRLDCFNSKLSLLEVADSTNQPVSFPLPLASKGCSMKRYFLNTLTWSYTASLSKLLPFSLLPQWREAVFIVSPMKLNCALMLPVMAAVSLPWWMPTLKLHY